MGNANRTMEKKLSDKLMLMTINLIALLPAAGFQVSNPQDAADDKTIIEISYKGRKVLEISSDYWSYYNIVSFVEYLDAEEIPNHEQLGEAAKITSKHDLVTYLESIREKVYPDLNKINIMDMLLDVAQDA